MCKRASDRAGVCERGGNGLCPVLTPSAVGDGLGSCGGEREDA